MERSLVALVAAGALLSGGSAAAHHSLATFDREKTVTINGTVKEFDWTNPHVFIEVVAEDSKGENVVWSVQASTPAVLARGGWRPSLLRPGDKISLSIHPRKDGLSGGYYADELPLLINGEPLLGKMSTPADASRCN